DEDAERERAGFLARQLLANELLADLWAVAVHDAHAPTGECQLDDRAQTLACMPKLIVDRRSLAGGRERVAAERHDRCALVIVSHPRGPSINVALRSGHRAHWYW